MLNHLICSQNYIRGEQIDFKILDFPMDCCRTILFIEDIAFPITIDTPRTAILKEVDMQ